MAFERRPIEARQGALGKPLPHLRLSVRCHHVGFVLAAYLCMLFTQPVRGACSTSKPDMRPIDYTKQVPRCLVSRCVSPKSLHPSGLHDSGADWEQLKRQQRLDHTHAAARAGGPAHTDHKRSSVHCMYTYTNSTQECICTKAWVGFGKTMLGSVVVCQWLYMYHQCFHS